MSATKILSRNDTAAAWVAANPILGEGEWGVETCEEGQTLCKTKIGNGFSAWLDLPYATEVSFSQDNKDKLDGIQAGAQVNPPAVSTDEINTPTDAIRSFSSNNIKDMAIKYAVSETEFPSLDSIDAGTTNIHLTTTLKSAYDNVAVRPKTIILNGTASSADNANIRAALTALKAAGGGRIEMSGEFMIGHSGDPTGIDPLDIPHLELCASGGYCKWSKGVVATATGTSGTDPVDGSAYTMLSRVTDDAMKKTLIIQGIEFVGDMTTKLLGNNSRILNLQNYDFVLLDDVRMARAAQTACAIMLCREVVVKGSIFEMIGLHGLDCSNSCEVSIDNNDFRWINGNSVNMVLGSTYYATRERQTRCRFSHNTVYGSQGVQLLGCDDVLIDSNKFKAYHTWGVYLGQDLTTLDGARAMVDARVINNTFEDLVSHSYNGGTNNINTAIYISQKGLSPVGVNISGNTLRQKTAGTATKAWSALKLYGATGEQRQWRKDGVWHDGTIVGEIFTGIGKGIQVISANAFDRKEILIEDNSIVSMNPDNVTRILVNWSGTQTWVVPLLAQEFPISSHRIANVDLRGYTQYRATVTFTDAPKAGTTFFCQWSMDGGVSWAAMPVSLTATATTGTQFGAVVDIPEAARSQNSILVSVWAANGDGTESSTITALRVDFKTYVKPDAPKAAPAELTAGTETNERRMSPADVKSMITQHGASRAATATLEELTTGAVTEDRLVTPQIVNLGIKALAVTKEATSVDSFSKMWVGPRKTWERMVTKPANTVALLHRTAVRTFRVQHGTTNVPLGANSKTLAVEQVDLSKQVLFNTTSRPVSAGYYSMTPDTNFPLISDAGFSLRMLDDSTIQFSRGTGTLTADMLGAFALVEFVGIAGDPYEIKNHGTYQFTNNTSGLATFTMDLTSTPTNIANCVPVITGIESTNGRMSALVHMTGTKTMNLEVPVFASAVTSTFTVTVLEFVGSAWKVHHAYQSAITADSGSSAMKDGILGAGTATTVANWTRAFILPQFLGDANNTNAVIPPSTYPRYRPGAVAGNVDWVFDAAHTGTAQKSYAFVVEDISTVDTVPMKVTRFNDISYTTPGWVNVDITSAALSAIEEAFPIIMSTQSLPSVPHNQFAVNLVSSTQARVACSRSHSPAATLDIQIVQLPRSA